MMERFKKALRWVYDWMTVLTASLVGIPEILLQVLSLIDGIDLTPILPPEHAVKIITGVALTKALLAWVESRMKDE